VSPTGLTRWHQPTATFRYSDPTSFRSSEYTRRPILSCCEQYSWSFGSSSSHLTQKHPLYADAFLSFRHRQPSVCWLHSACTSHICRCSRRIVSNTLFQRPSLSLPSGMTGITARRMTCDRHAGIDWPFASRILTSPSRSHCTLGGLSLSVH